MKLRFDEIRMEDIPELTICMTLAFDDDSQKHLGVPKGGPEGYDNGDFFRKWLFSYKESYGYKVTLDEEIIGGIIVWDMPHGRNSLGTIFIKPKYQNRGIGKKSWQFIEDSYPGVKSWTLGTPSWAIKNHHFYEKTCGFKKIREEVEEEDQISFIYQKAF